ncbi:DUF927 domain-containing protein, partial [Anoxybacteroides voinovskiense]
MNNQVPNGNNQVQKQAKKQSTSNINYYGREKDWVLSTNGLYQKIENKHGEKQWIRIANYTEIQKIRQNIETKDITLSIKYYYHGQYHEIEIARSQLNPNDFVKLNGKGIDVFHNNVKKVIEFLRIQEKKAPYEYAHCGMGWTQIDHRLCFKHHHIIGLAAFQSNYEGAYCIEPRGTLQGWLDIIHSEVIGNTHLELALAFGFSAPVVGLLSTQSGNDVDTLLVHVYGNSSKGKTTAAQVAVSPFGKPSRQGNGLIKSWNATHNAIVALLRGNYGVPIALDEASMSTIKDFSPLIYMFAENREKERLNKEGGFREQHTWATTLI